MPVREIWSGGQTGADRAALDVALELGVVHGGWVPAGRLAEDGVIASRYDRLRETESSEYAVRTEYNVRDTDGTLVVSCGPLAGGSLFTKETAHRLGKPCLHLDLDEVPLSGALRRAREWVGSLAPTARLNVAGPRASGCPYVYDRTARLLRAILTSEPSVRK